MRRSRGEDGQSVVEAVLILPLLLLLILAAVTLTQIIHANTVVLLASNEAARVGAVAYGDQTLAPEAARQRVVATAQGIVSNNLAGTAYTVNVANDGTDVAVTVAYTLTSPVPWWRLITGRTTVTAQHTATYRMERQ